MPEGHTIHRLARLIGGYHAGHVMRVSSPQGRFEDGAAALDGDVLVRTEGLGKHLLYHWENTQLVLHVHLGLFGRFRHWAPDPPEPRGAIRLRMRGPERTTDLSGPTACELLDGPAMEALRARIGPDPLRADADPERFFAVCHKTRRAIAKVLMDQRAIAGVGNVYRAELLYRARLDPMTPARDLSHDTVAALWDDTVELLRIGERTGRIVTVDPSRAPSRRKRSERYWVYKRSRCRTCDAEIQKADVENRTLYWCPVCQVG